MTSGKKGNAVGSRWPMSVEELTRNAYDAIRELHIRETGDELALECPPRVRWLLRMVDYMIRQRVLEHNDREYHKPRPAVPHQRKKKWSTKLGRDG